MTWGDFARGSYVDTPRRGRKAVAAGAAGGPNRGRRQWRSIDGRPADRSRQLADSGLAVSHAADRVIRELDWTSLKRPGRGVPPPRSGLGVT
jgi:hypothetical protein